MKIILSIIFLIICQSTLGQSGVNYSQSSKYNNLKLSLEDLKKIVSIINYYNAESLKDTSYRNRFYHFSCELTGNNGKAIAISTFKQIDNLKLDADYTGLDIEYTSNYTALSELKIRLQDYDRSISVTGVDENKVQALFGEINIQLESKSSWVAWDLILKIIIFCSYIIGVPVLLFLLSEVKKKEASKTTKVLTVTLGIYLFLVMAYVMSPITAEQLFPRFLLTSDSASFWDKHAGFIGFLGLIFAVLAFGYTIIHDLRKRKA